MLLNSGTRSLLSYTKGLTGDGADSPIWSDPRITAAINDAYMEMCEIARVHSEGIESKRSYATTGDAQLWYKLPPGFKRMISVEVDVLGSDLTGSSNPIWLKPLALDIALKGYETGQFSGTEFVAMGNQHFAVIAPAQTGGTNAMRMTYEADTAELSGDADEPLLPTVHHDLICYKAAISLRASENILHNDLLRLMLHKEKMFRIAMQERMLGVEDTMAIAGLTDNKHMTRFGRR